jgi:hypothetical protein
MRQVAFLAAAVALSCCGCAGQNGREHQRELEREHPCQFSATSSQCKHEEAVEQKSLEARHDTKALRERARVAAERAQLHKELAK